MFLQLDKMYIEASVKPTEVITGGARGADAIAAHWARNAGLDCTVVPADWDSHGLNAGFERNLIMADMAPDLVVAFVDKPLETSKGTAHMVETAKARNIPVRVFQAVKNRVGRSTCPQCDLLFHDLPDHLLHSTCGLVVSFRRNF